MDTKENIIPEGARTIFIENVGTIIIPKRNTEQDILDVVKELGDDLDTLKELFSVVKVCDENIKDKSNGKEIKLRSPNT